MSATGQKMGILETQQRNDFSGHYLIKASDVSHPL
jgi:hypothetical protein